MRRIVIGVDGSEQATAALAWAGRLAGTTGAQLEAVTVVPHQPMAAWLGMATHDDELLQARATVLEAACDNLDLEAVTTSVLDGQPASALLGKADGADLLVIGTHGHGALESTLLGSMSRQIVTHAVCPTVLVPHDPGRLRRAVVGVDGSEAALHALRWAVDLAELAAVELEVVTCFQPVPVGVTSPWMPAVPVITPGELRAAAEEALDSAIDQADAAAVVVERTVAEGRAATRLRDRARHADLLVVGSRGHGGFAGLLLGSVSQGCLTAPPCPVAVIGSGASPG